MSDPVYNKLVFRGYMIFILYMGGVTRKFPYRTYEEMQDLTKSKDNFPSPAEACMLIANSERFLGFMCAPHHVEDLEGNTLWVNEDVVNVENAS